MACNIIYNSSITGDCTNTNLGAFNIDIENQSPGYSIQWISPRTDTVVLPDVPGDIVTYSVTSLSAGTYTFNIVDSCVPNTEMLVNVNISSGTCISIINHTDTLCGNNNGSLTASTSYIYGTPSFYLYENTAGYIISGQSYGNTFEFTNLSGGTYYVIGDDGGGCTGKSESCIVKSSTTIDYSFYVVNDAGCNVESGKVFITELTGNPPYTYLWSNGVTKNSISGLTSGTYNVTVTDSTGCGVNKSCFVGNVEPVGFGVAYITSPSCFSNNGEVSITITGGTAPFYYLGNGVSNITFDRTVIFDNLSSGVFTIQVTDAGLCTFTSSVTLLVPNGLSLLSVSTTNSTCNDSSGVLGPITVFGGSPPYTYTLTNNGSSVSQVTPNTTWKFDNLQSGTYTLKIEDLGNCVYESDYTISNIVKYGLTTYTTGTTCNGSDGSIRLEITTGGVPPYVYSINGESINTSLTSYTFNNLTSGNYTASVVDNLLCYQSKIVTIDSSDTVDFQITGTDSTNGSDGSLNIYITNGQPPFVVYLDNVVVGSASMTINNLPAATYAIRVDNNLCSKTKTFKLNGVNNFQSYEIFTICDGTLSSEGTNIRTGLKEMLNEGYNDLIFGETNCVLNTAIFVAYVTIGDYTGSTQFYTGTTLNEYPTDTLWEETITDLIYGSPQIGEVIIDGNTITINTNCDETSLYSSNVLISLKIIYEIGKPCPPPTPTPTPTNTPTPTITPTYTPTPTPTSTSIPQTLACSSASSYGGSVITDTTIDLDPLGGVITMLFRTGNLPDKLEIYHGVPENLGINKKATSSIIASENYGPFDNVYGTKPDDVLPNSIQADGVNQFLGTLKGIPERRFEYSVDTGYYIPTMVYNPPTSFAYEQVIWWKYTSSDYLSGSTATVRVTGLDDETTGWFFYRLCTTIPIPYLPLSVSGNTFISFRMSASTSSSFLVNWGDGDVESYDGSGVTVSHTYLTPYIGNIGVLNYGGNGLITHIDAFSSTTTTDSVQFTTSQLSGFTGLLRFDCQISNRISGDIDLLPNTLTFFRCYGSNTISGNIANMPPLLITFDLQGQNTTTGDITNLPSSLTTYGNHGNNTTFGDMSSLKPNLKIHDNRGLNYTSGDIGDISSGMTYYLNWGSGSKDSGNVSPFQEITGDIADLPSSLTYFNIKGYNTTFGDIATLPSGMTLYSNWGYNTTSGDVTNLKVKMNSYSNRGNNTVSGTLQSITTATGLTIFESIGLNTISGELHNAPAELRFFSLQGESNNITYFSGRTWPSASVGVTGVQFVFINPNDGSMTATKASALVMDLANSTWSTFPTGQPRQISTPVSFSGLTSDAQFELTGSTGNLKIQDVYYVKAGLL